MCLALTSIYLSGQHMAGVMASSRLVGCHAQR